MYYFLIYDKATKSLVNHPLGMRLYETLKECNDAIFTYLPQGDYTAKKVDREAFFKLIKRV